MSVEKVVDLDAIRESLLDAAEGSWEMWGQRYERDVADLLALLDEAVGLLGDCCAYEGEPDETDPWPLVWEFLARFPAPSPTDEETT